MDFYSLWLGAVKKPFPKIELLKELYLQLVVEMVHVDDELICSDQIAIFLSDDFIFEVRFKKKTVLSLVEES